MPNAREDMVAVEAAADLLVRGLGKADISSLTDLVTEVTTVLAPTRRTAKGKAVVEFWRNMAVGNEGIRMMSTDLDTVAEGVVRDVGTLSMRRKGAEQRDFFRYLLLWHKVGSEWKLAAMTWNRDAQASGGRSQAGTQAGTAMGEM